MSKHSSLDPECFQKLLADAFVVQKSGIESRSLCALVELQGWVATGKLDVDRAMHMVADRARNVADAAGIAIALLKGDQLVYQAGSGSSAACVGRHVGTASIVTYSGGRSPLSRPAIPMAIPQRIPIQTGRPGWTFSLRALRLILNIHLVIRR